MYRAQDIVEEAPQLTVLLYMRQTSERRQVLNLEALMDIVAGMGLPYTYAPDMACRCLRALYRHCVDTPRQHRWLSVHAERVMVTSSPMHVTNIH